MGIINCAFGNHTYSDWYIRYDTDDKDTWWERKCTVCGHIEQREFLDNVGDE